MSTYLGGQTHDRAVAVVVHGPAAYVAGWTHSADFPVRNAYQSTMQSPSACEEHHPYYVTYRCSDGFLYKIVDEANPRTHQRKVSLALRGDLVAVGRVFSTDGFAGCFRRVPVRIITDVSAKEVVVGKATTDAEGRYRVRIPDRTGFYVARIPEVNRSAADVCQRSRSVWRVHSH